MPDRYALVSGSFMPREGGAEKQMRQVLGRLSSGGARVRVVTQPIQHEPRRASIPGTSVQIQRVGSLGAFRRTPRLAQLLFCLVASFRVAVFRPRVIISLQFGAATVAASLAARVTGARHIIRLTGGGTSRYRSESVARADSWAGRRLVAIATGYRRVTLVAPAQHLLSDFKESFPDRPVEVMCVPNGVEVPSRHVTIADVDRRGVVWYARSGSERSHELFFSVVACRPDLEFLVVGQPVPTNGRANVTSLGWCSDVFAVLGRARVLLNTSVAEGSPNMALQAVAAGCFVVGVDNAGIEELKVRYPDHVSTYSLESPEAAAELIDRLHHKTLPRQASVPTPDVTAGRWNELLMDPT